MSTNFGVRSSLRSDAAKRIEAAGHAFQAAREAQVRPPDPTPASVPPTTPAESGSRPGQCRRIIEEVACRYRLPVSEILSDRRSKAVIPARHEAVYRCVSETPLSLPAIGRIFHRDHTSIGHAVMRHHLRTGAPLPRGMDWKAGRRRRHGPRSSDQPTTH